VCGGCQTQDQKLGVLVAEARDGLAPVVPLAKGETLFTGNGLAVANQARTLPASNHIALELDNGVLGGHLRSSLADAKSRFIFE
jgi:hypothetical protein